MKIAFRLLLTGCLAAVLIACGGGSGSDVAVAQPPLASLVPVARPVGATIAADASIFRPLKVGSKASYRGEISESNSTSINVYTSEETQSEALVNGVRVSETRSDGKGEGPSDIFVVNGTIKTIDSVDFAGKDLAERVELIEMRSPVRIDDQWTSFERRFDDTAFDFDGDGKKDKLDVAIYSRVVGAETISLPNLPDMQALRVDTYVSTRYISSATGLPSVTAELPPVKTWYVAGVGVVRQTITTPTSASATKTEDLKLTSWDGLTDGIGAMAPTEATLENGDRFAPPAGASMNVFAFDQHALAVRWNTIGSAGQPATATKVNLRGKVVQSLPLALPDGDYFSSADASGVVFVQKSSSDVGQRAIYHLDSSGKLINEPGISIINLRGTARSDDNFLLRAIALDKNTVWVLWSRAAVGSSLVAKDEGVLRAFSPDGRPLGPELIIGSFIGGGAISAKNGSALFTFSEQESRDFVYFSKSKYGSASPSGIIFNRVLAPLANVSTPIALDGVSILTWAGPFDSTYSSYFAGGILLDTQLQPIRSGLSFNDEAILGFAGLGKVSSAGTRKLAYFTRQEAPLYLVANSAGPTFVLGWLDVIDLPLSKTVTRSVRFPFEASQNEQNVVYFKDRAMLFFERFTQLGNGILSNRLVTTTVWLNEGQKF